MDFLDNTAQRLKAFFQRLFGFAQTPLDANYFEREFGGIRQDPEYFEEQFGSVSTSEPLFSWSSSLGDSSSAHAIGVDYPSVGTHCGWVGTAIQNNIDGTPMIGGINGIDINGHPYGVTDSTFGTDFGSGTSFDSIGSSDPINTGF